MAVNVNTIRFFELYDSDPALRQRVQEAEDMYPGSLELREAVVENVLLPIAAELGLPFTVEDVRAYETRKFMASKKDLPEGEEPEEQVYWLLNRGWSNDESKFCGDEE